MHNMFWIDSMYHENENWRGRDKFIIVWEKEFYPLGSTIIISEFNLWNFTNVNQINCLSKRWNKEPNKISWCLR